MQREISHWLTAQSLTFLAVLLSPPAIFLTELSNHKSLESTNPSVKEAHIQDAEVIERMRE
jgi:hypothetical protein